MASQAKRATLVFMYLSAYNKQRNPSLVIGTRTYSTKTITGYQANPGLAAHLLAGSYYQGALPARAWRGVP
jgi:hypothetical protein